MKQSEVIAILKRNIQDQLERVEAISRLGEAALSSNPDKDSWNALQCLEHLNRYAEFYLMEIEEKTKSKTPINKAQETRMKMEDLEFQPGFWGAKFIKSMLADQNGKIKKMNTFKSKNPSLQEAKRDSLVRFLAYQEKWLSILDRAKAFDLNRNKCSLTIPIIKMNLGATLQFVIAHQERHVNQAERALSVVKP